MKSKVGRHYEVSVYGFGSYFNSSEIFKDIDLLILHGDTSVPSCDFAIDCKKRIMEQLPLAHISILSRGEEYELGFIETSNALHIGTINSLSAVSDTQRILDFVHSSRTPRTHTDQLANDVGNETIQGK